MKVIDILFTYAFVNVLLFVISHSYYECYENKPYAGIYLSMMISYRLLFIFKYIVIKITQKTITNVLQISYLSTLLVIIVLTYIGICFNWYLPVDRIIYIIFLNSEFTLAVTLGICIILYLKNNRYIR